MKSSWRFRLLVKLHSAELVRAAYIGLLGRPPDEAGLKMYRAELGRSPAEGGRNLAELLSALSRSPEHWKRSLEQRAEELVRTAFKAILRREPSEQEIKTSAAQLREDGELARLLNAVATSQEHWDQSLARKSRELVLTLYRSIFNRDPDSRSLETYAAQLAASKDIPSLLSVIAASQEFWHKQLASRAEEFVRAAYQTLLGREPDEGALRAYGAQLREHKSIAELLRAITHSQEHWEVLVRKRSEELVRTVFSALLNRDPEEAALKAYVTQLDSGLRLGDLLSAIGRSEEHWARLLDERAEQLVGAIFRGLLGRDPDNVGLAAYVTRLKASKDLANVVALIGKSQERSRKLKIEQDSPHPATSYEDRTWVFVHVQKTGGTSLQNMLAESFGADNLYQEHGDVLHLHSPAELSTYSAFAGHFNYDSLAFIPRRKLSIFTFVREPKQRLLSLYHFWRAHDPSAPGFHDRMRLANDLDIETFYRCDEIARRRDTWNHMTWCIMGERQWKRWRSLLANTAPPDRARVIESLRAPIRERLREFCFVGLQEDFAVSCRLLFRILARPCPEERVDHSVEKLAAIHPHIRKLDKPAISPLADQAMAELVELDTLVYEEASCLYAERLALHRVGSKPRGNPRLVQGKIRAQRAKARGR
jgi:Domain of unknown function (DUF4214)/Sulfotransferase family